MSAIFEGIKIIDFTNNLAGPVSTQMFADYGAEVVKVERPVAGDDTRGIMPKIEGQALFYLWANRGKKSVTLALDDPRAQDVVKAMAADCDIVIESYKPGTMKKFGLDYESLSKVNEKLIYCSISFAGQDGIYSRRPGFDILAQGMSGFLDMTGEKDGSPAKCGTAIGDYLAAINSFGAITAALFHRNRTGEGQYIDISLLDGLIAVNTCADQAATIGTQPTRMGNHHNTLAPYGVFRGNNNESCIIAAYTAGTWSKLCNAINLPELKTDSRFCGNMQRMENLDALVAILETWIKEFSCIDEAVDILIRNDVPAAKIRSTAEMIRDPEHWRRGALIEMPGLPSMEQYKTICGRGPWMHFSKTPGVVKRASGLGEYNEEILTRYGMTSDEVKDCQQKWSSKFKPQ